MDVGKEKGGGARARRGWEKGRKKAGLGKQSDTRVNMLIRYSGGKARKQCPVIPAPSDVPKRREGPATSASALSHIPSTHLGKFAVLVP